MILRVAVGLERQKFAAGNSKALIEAARSLSLTATIADKLDSQELSLAEHAKVAAVAALQEAGSLQTLDFKKLEADPAFAVLKDRADFKQLETK